MKLNREQPKNYSVQIQFDCDEECIQLTEEQYTEIVDFVCTYVAPYWPVGEKEPR
jgi:hypothetical protein